ncbi:protein kintoun isoform X1 [Hemiscyllium ocellatum]|uniref:protein kintoun isoform X1 n=1 Tax=Hemiscyllium ocellatum TaxID=170820 RepID=UPI0029662371|nr:protein kintoun isoform X1 [Hemiscyllium ocellatum]
MASFSKLEDLDLTRDEVERFSTAFKDEKFRKMLCEYAEEISSPENKKKYEEEITQLEKERGMDIKFVHPKPGYVLKTSVNGDQKCFINVCSNDLIHKPFCKAEKGANGTVGQHWSLPYSLAPGREDLGKGGRKHMIYDVVFHPDTLYMANKNKKFKTMVDQTSIEVIEKQLNAKLDSRNFKTLKVKYKGMPEAAVIRKPIPGVPKKPPDDDDPLQFPYPFGSLKSETPSGHGTKSKTTSKSAETAMKDKNTKSQDSKSTQPKYSIIHRSHIDLQDYRYARDAASSTRPKELVIAIDLPLLKSAENACLDVTEQFLSLESQKPAYKLDLHLPYPVDENLGSAMFNKSKRQLVVTLPVLPMKQALEVGQFSAGDFKQTRNESTESGQLLCKSDCQLEGYSHQQNGGRFGDGVNPESEFEFSTLQVSTLVQSENNEHFKLNESKTFTESTAKEVAIVSNKTLAKPNDVIASSKLVSEVDREEQENVAKEGAIAISGKESLGTLEKVCSPSADEQVDVGADSSANTAFYYGDYLKKTEPVCPDFHYHQNKDTITFVLHVQNINEESFKSVLHTHDYRVVFGTQDSDVLYSLIVQFPPEHQLDTAESVVNISKDNAAVVLMKSPECRGLWQSFHAGESCNCLQKNLCVTSENINQFLSTSLEDPVTNELPEKHPLISVVEISESGLVIHSKQQESENTSSQGLSLKLDKVNHNEACNAANVQKQTEETSVSESIAEGKILEEETPLANDAVEFVSNDKYQLVAMAGTDNFLETTNAGEGTNNEVPNYDRNQLTHSNCWTSVNASKLISEVKMKSESPSHASTICVDKPLSVNDEPLLVNCEKSVHFKQCTEVDDNVLDEDDFPSNQKDENTPKFINTTAPLQILEEINPNDQSVKIISDHKTKSAFNFQSMELYQLD